MEGSGSVQIITDSGPGHSEISGPGKLPVPVPCTLNEVPAPVRDGTTVTYIWCAVAMVKMIGFFLSVVKQFVSLI
jgi:hypothetical protein